MPRLHVNIDHVATLRQARHSTQPDPTAAAGICERAGAAGITVHLREDRRHIQDHDVRALRHAVRGVLNLEMAATEEMATIACEVLPDEVCIVPERREELTTEGGLDVAASRTALAAIIPRLKSEGISVSIFISPDCASVEAAAQAGADIVELHTGAYAHAPSGRRESELARLVKSARAAHGCGLRVNAGHGLDLDNVGPVARLPYAEELNIGYAIVCRAVFVGLETAVREMAERIRAATPA